MAMIPKSTRERWRALLEAAMPGPWSVTETPGFGHDHAPYTVVDDRDEQIAECYDNTPGKRPLVENEANAALIASTPDAMSQLLDENARLRELVRELLDVGRYGLNVIGHPDDAVNIAIKDRISAITTEVEE
jgi:hypothetical protein